MANYSDSSDECSESTFFNSSLSFWRNGLAANSAEYDPVLIDLHTACSIGHASVVNALVKDLSEDLNRPNSGGWSPLMYASYIGHDSIVATLLDAGADVDVRNPRGQTPLMLAASCGNEVVCECLKDLGNCEVDTCDDSGWTALVHAVYNGHQNMVKTLLEWGCNVNCCDRQGFTPLMHASKECHEIIVQYLLEHGASAGSASKAGHSARSLALDKGSMKIVAMIDKYLTPSARNARTSQPPRSASPSVRSGYESGSTRASPQAASPTEFHRQSFPPSHAEGPTASHRSSTPAHQSPTPPVHPTTAHVHTHVPVSPRDGRPPPLAVQPSAAADGRPARLPLAGFDDAATADGWDAGDPRDLADLMHRLHLSKYMPLFEEQELDLRLFWTLTDSDLREVGVKLLGPRRKMTNAIARWRSGIRIVGPAEQAYADGLEVEMQETAVRLHQLAADVERLQAQLAQESQLRSIAEHALVQHKANWEFFVQHSAVARQHCDWLLRSLSRYKACQNETWFRQLSVHGEEAPSSGNPELDAIAANLRNQIVALSDRDLWQTTQNAVRDTLNAAVAVADGLDKAFRVGRGAQAGPQDEVL